MPTLSLNGEEYISFLVSSSISYIFFHLLWDVGLSLFLFDIIIIKLLATFIRYDKHCQIRGKCWLLLLFSGSFYISLQF